MTLKGLRMAILAATGTARKRVIPAVRAQDLCTIAAVHGRDRNKLAALAKENSIPHYFVGAERNVRSNETARPLPHLPKLSSHEQ
jgi:predicted dehydrogenase